MFSGKDLPSVGFSFGIERIFVILEAIHKNAAWLRGPSTHVLVATIGKDLALERLKLASELWKAGINTEILYEENPKPQKFISHALDNMIPFMIWIGADEIVNGQAKIKVSIFLTFSLKIYSNQCTYLNEETIVDRLTIADSVKQLVSRYEEDLVSGKVVYAMEETQVKKGGKKGE